MTETLRRRDLDFLLFEVLKADRLCERPRHAAHDRQGLALMLDAAQRIADGPFHACAADGDRDSTTIVDGRVRMTPGAGPAMTALIEAGFIAATFDEAHGGLQLPVTIGNACMAMFQAANIGLCGLPLLTIGVANLIDAWGSPAQKALYIPRLLDGTCYGTMCLSEPHAGSSLTEIRTRAEHLAGTDYRITGTKMWITGGEHELSPNIVHMVLAKIPGGPPGVKGISLFIVPRYRVNPDGTAGAPNDVSLAGLNHKMGQRISPNCVLSFGERGDCVGQLVGEPHRGLEYMFHMMNEARIAVGLAAVAAGYAGYLCSLGYARERTQGRSARNRDPASPMVPIVQHADVRRMLLAQKVAAEGGLALCLYASMLVDEQRTHPDPAARREAHLLLEVLIPVVKAWPSEWCLEANKHAIQILGGYGYTRDFPVERLYRDNRLNMIHEGTNGIHALDLLGRKVTMQDGAGFDLAMARIDATLAEAAGDADLVDCVAALARARRLVAETTAALRAVPDPDVRLANASLYLDLFGHLVIGWLWLAQALAARAGSAAAVGAERDFYAGKIAACRWFMHRELVRLPALAQVLSALDTQCLDMPEAAF